MKKEIIDIARNQNLKSKDCGEKLLEESLKFYELIEYAYQAIIFSFNALEAFINISIPENFILKKENSKNTEIYNKSQTERYFSWKDKIDFLGKEIYKLDGVKKEPFWQGLNDLEKLRNRLIHMKSTDDTSIIEDIMKSDLPKLCESSEKFIAHIYSNAFVKDNLHSNLSKFPYVKSLERLYVLGKEVDEITPMITEEEFIAQCNED